MHVGVGALWDELSAAVAGVFAFDKGVDFHGQLANRPHRGG